MSLKWDLYRKKMEYMEYRSKVEAVLNIKGTVLRDRAFLLNQLRMKISSCRIFLISYEVYHG